MMPGAKTGNIFREFSNEAEARTWGQENYPKLLALPEESNLYQLIFAYTGSWYQVLNRYLRLWPVLGSKEFDTIDSAFYKKYLEAIHTINQTLCEYALTEGIIVYRYTHKKDIHNLCSAKFLREGMLFSDKAFFSTTLVRSLLSDFGKENHCDCILKLCLPKGTHGAYVSFDNNFSRLNEQEFLLPPNINFKITKINRFSLPMEIECIAIIGQ